MPNWCSNSLTLTHDDPKMIRRAIQAFKKGALLNEFVPTPPELLNDELTTSYADDEKQARVDELKNACFQKYGYESWYDFAVAEWGTKWDVGGKNETVSVIDKHNVKFYFDSAWSPPVNAYAKFEELGFSVNAFYYEPGICFAGQYYDGSEENIDFSGMSVEKLEQVISPELDEEFNIVEQVRDWEEENAEDADE